ncbi:MAG: hypothetical protein IPJ65_07430 [Archangiaceae bacterium]|nr:hypothetical protein [Archangiaceae bacterium]
MSPQEAEGLPAAKLAEVLAAAVKAKDPSLAEALAKSKNKEVQRAAKKALYQLKSSGVAVATEAPRGEQPDLSPKTEELPALLSQISGMGERALFFVKARAGGGLDTYQAIVTDELGIVQLDRGETQRSKYRRHLEQVRHEQPHVLEVPLERALEELAVAWTINGIAKHPLPAEWESLLRRLGVVAKPEWPAPQAPSDEDTALAARSGALVEEREIASWLPGAKGIQLLSARIDEVDTSPLQLSEQQKHEQRLQKAAITAAELDAPERKVWAMRLWRSAEMMEKTGRAEQAKLARAEAKVLYHREKSPSRFLEKMFEKIVMLAEQARAAQLAQAQGLPQAPPPPEHKSPGGLIVP